jgi:hypothetical protein
VFCGWVNQRQTDIINFQNAQIDALLKKLGKKRILLTDDQRRILAVKGKSIGRKALRELTTIVTPDTILRIEHSWPRSGTTARNGSLVGHEFVKLLSIWSSDSQRRIQSGVSTGFKIQGALKNVGYFISDTTVGNILKAHGIEPAPDRQSTGSWSRFLKAHWDVMAAIDFTTVEVWTPSGLTTMHLLFVMEVKTRRVHLAACTSSLGDNFMKALLTCDVV